jgi:HlyD family secretion protein
MKTFTRIMLRVLIVLLVVGALGGAAWGGYAWWTSGPKLPPFRTAEVTRGKLTATIPATGTIEPEEVIDVGAQVLGQIIRFETDPRDKDKSPSEQRPVDYCTPVKEGDVLALIDKKLYAPDVDIAQQDVAVAQAGVTRAESDLAAARSKLDQTQRDWERYKKLGPSGAASQSDYDTAQNAFETARVNIPSMEAALLVAKRNVDRAKAVLDKAQTNLGYCTITSPVNGVIIDRRVNVGQTVVASLSAPSLFLIAKDLMKLQVWVTVNEADIGNIKVGQPVTFTVDARPGHVFRGMVQKIRYNAVNTQNVVVYVVEVATENEMLPKPVQEEITLPTGRKLKIDSEYMLLPYMTASTQFQVSHRDDALLVPNAALRWRPQLEQVAPESRDLFLKTQKRKGGQPGEEPKVDQAKGGDKGDKGDKPQRGRGVVWVEDGGYVRSLEVFTGITDNTQTEVKLPEGVELPVGTALITGENKAGGGGGTTNPFTPQFNGGQRRPQ